MKFALLLATFALIIFLLSKRIERAFCHLRMLAMCSDCKVFLKQFIVIDNLKRIASEDSLQMLYNDLKSKDNITEDLKIFLSEMEK